MRPYLTTQSARELRRAEQRRGRRRAAAPVRQAVPVLIWADQMLSQIDEIAVRLHIDGSLEIDEAGDPVVLGPDGREWAAGPAIEGVVEVFDQWRQQNGAELDLEPLRELASRLQDGGMITLETLDRVTVLLARLRRIAMRMSPSEADPAIASTLSKNLLES